MNEDYDPSITSDEVIRAIKAIKIDTAPGPDRVIVRAVKNSKVINILAHIFTKISRTGTIPASLQEARTILIHKGGDENDPCNFRPISICSVLRRAFERILDSRLRQYITFNPHQRGFTTCPGTHVNISILDSALRKAKKNKENLTVVFLDITKAFDNVGHLHIQKTLENSPLPIKLRNLILALQTGNRTTINCNGQKTAPVQIKRGILQGVPLSPALYNIATDFVLDELSETTISEKYGYELVKGLPKITVLGFADDTVIIAKNNEDAAILTNIVIQRFKEIGLLINTSKSSAINIAKGKLNNSPISLDSNTQIKSIGESENIKYLGINFSDQLIFDETKTVNELKEHLNLLVGSPLLKPEQKFSVINQFIVPSLTYRFQNLNKFKISKLFLSTLDKLIRSAVKEILQLPTDTPDAMLYSSRRVKGLGIFRAQWETLLQQLNSYRILERSHNEHINATRNLHADKLKCLEELGLNNQKNMTMKTSDIRGQLRSQEFQKWCQLCVHGKGVVLYAEYPPANRWLENRKGLSSSEWREALKLQGNVAPVRAIHGRSLDGTRCRHCSEKETLAHVLGFCPFGELLRNNRHHRIRSKIAASLLERNFETYEEVHCIAENGSSRRVDILTIDRKNKSGFIVDPTVRFEINAEQPAMVDREKKEIYEPTVEYFKNKYGLKEVSVIGLLVGSRGTITKEFVKLC